MFKRYVFGDGQWLLVNGYSITFYEERLTQNMMDKMVRWPCYPPRRRRGQADITSTCPQEHTWYEGYRLSFEDRPHIPERHDPTGLKCKQTFYIVSRSSRRLPVRSLTLPLHLCRTILCASFPRSPSIARSADLHLAPPCRNPSVPTRRS